MRRLRLLPALVLSAIVPPAAGAAEARGRPAPPLRVTIAVPAAGSATFATTIVTPAAGARRPRVTVLRAGLPRTLAASVRIARRTDGKFLLTTFLVNRAAGVRPGFRIEIADARRVRSSIVTDVEAWPRAPFAPCRVLDNARPVGARTAYFADGGRPVRERDLAALGRDLVCDEPASPAVLGRVGLPAGAFTLSGAGTTNLRVTGSFTVPVSTFFLTPVPNVVGVTCPAGLQCGAERRRPNEPIVVYQGSIPPRAALSTEIVTGRPLSRAAVDRLALSFYASGEQVGPVDVLGPR